MYLLTQYRKTTSQFNTALSDTICYKTIDLTETLTNKTISKR